jgi:CRISPR/Cas system CMR-associated protein Cmr3 (group 5 of RAMP superfamily)
LLDSSDVSYIDGRNEIGFYSIEVYTFIDGSKIGFMGGNDADYLENILNELGHYKH